MVTDAPKRSGSRKLVLVHVLARIAALGCWLASAAITVAAPVTSTIGQTWPIAEQDALAEIEAKAATLPADMSKAFGPRETWSALKAAPLPRATASRVRSVVPFYTLDFDITLPDGKTLYPRGFTFNPLTYVKLPQRLVVVHSGQLDWALKAAKPSDFILLAAQGTKSDDPIELTERTGRPIFILEERVKQRLGLTVAPVIVAQAGTRLILSEYGPQGLTAQKEARP